MSKRLIISIKLFVFMTILTGIIYPLFITLISYAFMHEKANGSLIKQNDKLVGSILIGQKFSGNKYFWSRPSAIDYNPMGPSGGSNLGPTSKKLVEIVKKRKEEWGENAPIDLLFSSGSGLDPHISVEAALIQVSRVASARSIDEKILTKLIHENIEGNFLGFLGPQHINVLKMNLALDQLDGR